MLTCEDLERREAESLAPYAALSSRSRGRDHPVEPDGLRTAYQRDRDRIVHCAAFRKLEHKTQVYVIHEGDYYRTRLTHTMEVAQIARTLARSLRLNADLTEAIALAHDLGHTPFGHSGEIALDRLMADAGGFNHNRQSLRVVERLEERYRSFRGLNLTWEVREGIAKHCTSYDTPACLERFEPDLAPTLEAQTVEVADEIAFNHHDLDDALKMGIITRHDLVRVEWIDALAAEIEAGDTAATAAWDGFARHRLVGRMIELAVRDVLDTADEALARAAVASIDDVRAHAERLVAFSPDATERNRALRQFLMESVYRHPTVVRMTSRAERFIDPLFALYLETPRQLPLHFRQRIEPEGAKRVIADYISGMTDRYCLEEHRRVFVPDAAMRD